MKFPQKIINNPGNTLPLLVSLVFVFFLSRYFLSAGPLWRDEIVHVNHSLMSIQDMWSALSIRPFPMGSLILFHLLAKLGLSSSDFLIRLYGTGIYLLIFSSLWWWNRKLGLGSPVLMWGTVAFNPGFFWIANAVRPYSLGLLFAILLFFQYWSCIRSFSLKNCLLLLLLLLLSVHTMYQNAFFVFAFTLAAVVISFLRKTWRELGLFILLGSLTALTLIPNAEKIVAAGEWSVLTKAQFPFIYYLRALLYSFADISAFTGKVHVLFWIILALFIIFSLLKRKKQDGIRSDEASFVIYLVISLAVAAPLLFMTIKLSQVLPQNWHFAFILLIAGLAVSSLAQMLLSNRTVTIFAIFFLVTNIYPLWALSGTRQSNMDNIAQRLETEANPNDLIIVNPWFFGTTFERYYKGGVQWMTLPPLEDYSLTRYDLLKKKMQQADPLREVFEAVNKRINENGIIWHVGYFKKLKESINLEPAGPAPESPFGWSAAGYARHWSLQLSEYFKDRNMSSKLIRTYDTNRYFPWSHVTLYKISASK